MLSKNLIKASQFVLKENEPVMVNTNDLLVKKIEAFHPEIIADSGGFKSGLNAPEIDPLLYDADSLMEAANLEEAAAQVYTGPTPEELLAQAEEEIRQRKEQAEAEIAGERENAMAAGRQEGYDEGFRKAQSELEGAKQELEKKAQKLEQEYQNLIDSLEPQFIRTITGIYEEIFKVELAGYKPILSYAIANTIRHIEGARDFLIHVSREDYKAMEEQKPALLEKLSSGQISIEFIEDATLNANDCMIETSGGIIDCGIGTQLEELTRKLRLLSFEG